MVYSASVKELLIATPPRRKSGGAARLDLGKSLKGWRTDSAPWKDVHARASLPDVTMVQVDATAGGAGFTEFIKDLAAKQDGTSTPTLVVLWFDGVKPPSSIKLAEYLRRFHRQEQVEVRWNLKQPNVAHLLVEIESKLKVLREVAAAKPRPPLRASPMDKFATVLAATRDLRLENGRLSAQRVAGLYGIPLNELAGWLGRSRQALHKTPDAEALQPALAFFERVARLRMRLTDDDFRKWLRVPNELLEDQRPLDLLANGQWQELADFVDDMLTGSPM
jgi:hypothetical protein